MIRTFAWRLRSKYTHSFLKHACDDLQTSLSLTMADRDRIQSEVERLRAELESASRTQKRLEGNWQLFCHRERGA